MGNRWSAAVRFADDSPTASDGCYADARERLGG